MPIAFIIPPKNLIREMCPSVHYFFRKNKKSSSLHSGANC